MKDLVNEGRNLQDKFKNKLVKENPMVGSVINLNENFPGPGETVLAKYLDYAMLDYFSRTNKKLSIDTKTKKGIYGSVGKMYNDLVFNGDSINKKDIVQVKILESNVNENPMMSPSITAPSKADVHYKINHPVLTLLGIDRDKSGFSSLRATKTSMTMMFGFKSQVDNIESLKMDARKIARTICQMLDNYNTDYSPGTPLSVYNPDIKQDVIIVPISVSHWTGD